LRGGLSLVWRLALKANALYRDGSKLSQPLSSQLISGDDEDDDAADRVEELIMASPPARAAALAERIVERIVVLREREKLPNRRKSYIQKAPSAAIRSICTPRICRRAARRNFHRHAQERRLPQPDEQLRHRDFAGAAIWRAAGGICRRFTFTRFEPAGPVQGNDAIKYATSILDYVFRELAVSYLGRNDLRMCRPTTSPTTRSARASTKARPGAGAVSRGLVRSRRSG